MGMNGRAGAKKAEHSGGSELLTLEGEMAADLPPATPCKPGGDLKMRQILDGARRVFLADGFDGASMNDIARAAGVSKGTLYVYFPSKVALFETLIRDDRRRQAEQLFQFGPDEADIAEVLSRIGVGLMRMMCTAENLAHMRMVIGATAKHPEIGRAFYEAGPQCGGRRIGDYLRRLAAERRLVIPEPELAAHQFVQLIQSDYFKSAMFGVAKPGDDAAIEAAVASGVRAFMRAYAP
jgi:AcrR family transcriptional regulator